MNIGDRVKIVAEYTIFYGNIGFITEIIEGSGVPYTVHFSSNPYDDHCYFSEDELEVIK